MDNERILRIAYSTVERVSFLETKEEMELYFAALVDAMKWGWIDNPQFIS